MFNLLNNTQLNNPVSSLNNSNSGLKVEGINLLLADGEAAGQEVFHVHLHVLPRFRGDGFGHRFRPHYGQHAPREQLDADANVIRKALGVTA